MTAKKIATFKNPSIEACIKSLYRFDNIEDAKLKINSIADYFELSKKFEQSNQKITLWIKGFKISESEREQGYLGNFADIFIDQSKNKEFYTIKAKKHRIALKFHPQKKRIENIHPNWGHPILRGIKQGRKYHDVQDAMAELERLHIQYPNTSIPTGLIRVC